MMTTKGTTTMGPQGERGGGSLTRDSCKLRVKSASRPSDLIKFKAHRSIPHGEETGLHGGVDSHVKAFPAPSPLSSSRGPNGSGGPLGVSGGVTTGGGDGIPLTSPASAASSAASKALQPTGSAGVTPKGGSAMRAGKSTDGASAAPVAVISSAAAAAVTPSSPSGRIRRAGGMTPSSTATVAETRGEDGIRKGSSLTSERPNNSTNATSDPREDGASSSATTATPTRSSSGLTLKRDPGSSAPAPPKSGGGEDLGGKQPSSSSSIAADGPAVQGTVDSYSVNTRSMAPPGASRAPPPLIGESTVTKPPLESLIGDRSNASSVPPLSLSAKPLASIAATPLAPRGNLSTSSSAVDSLGSDGGGGGEDMRKAYSEMKRAYDDMKVR